MHATSEARRAPKAVRLHGGLTVSEVHARLEEGLRFHDTGQRVLAFYLTEMADRRLYQATGHSSTAHYAETRLGLDRRRTAELIAVGRTLLTLPRIDEAFCGGRLVWSKVLHLARVATPPHEEAWLERALASSCRELALAVRQARPGSPPRPPGDTKGLPEVRFRVSAHVSALTHQKLDLAKRKMAAERGRPVDDAECLDVLADLFLSTAADGSVPGRNRIDASLYRIVLRPGEGAGEGLVVDTDLGPVPVDGGEDDDPSSRVRSEYLRCDGEQVVVEDEPRPGAERPDSPTAERPDSPTAERPDSPTAERPDRKTPPALRRRVMARDGGRCRCCGSRHRLMVHHIHYRSEGGPTRASNLITLCVSCHALVHANLLVLEGDHAERVRFLDANRQPLEGPPAPSEGSVLSIEPPSPERAARTSPITLEDVPERIDGAWWGRHGPLVRFRRDTGLELVAGEPLLDDDRGRRGAPPAREDAFAGVVGQRALVERLEATASGSRARGEAFPHALLCGPAGTGKTTLARGIAARLGARLHEASGPLLQDVHVLIRLLATLEEGDVLFLDEVHAVPLPVLEALYEAMAARCVTLTLHAGARARTVRLELPPFTLLAATTEEGELPEPLWGRFGLRERLGHYEEGDLAAIVAGAARSRGSFLTAEAAARLGAFARGTPREALRLLDRTLAWPACSERARPWSCAASSPSSSAAACSS